METLVLWGIGLTALGILLFVIELFVPSGGVISIAAVVSLISGCVAFWMEGWAWGLSSTLFVLILVPLGANFAIKLMPHTPMGRDLFLSGEDEAEMQRRELAQREAEQAMEALIGAEGVASTDLRPVGMAVIEGTRVQVLSIAGMIEKGSPCRVVAIEGDQIKVRPIAT